MDHDEFKKLYTEIEQKLGERFWLIPRDRAMIAIGACTVFLALTIGTTWLAAKTAVSGTVAAQATKQIVECEQDATNAVARIRASAEHRPICDGDEIYLTIHGKQFSVQPAKVGESPKIIATEFVGNDEVFTLKRK